MKIAATALSPFAAHVAETLKDHQSEAKNNETHVADVIREMNKPQDLTNAINITHEAQRLYLAAAGGLLGNNDVMTAIAKNKETWKYSGSIGLTPDEFSAMGKQAYLAGQNTQASVLVLAQSYGVGYTEPLVATAHKHGNAVGFVFEDEWCKEMLISQCTSREQAAAIGQAVGEPRYAFDRRISLSSKYKMFKGGKAAAYDKEIRNGYVGAVKIAERENKPKQNAIYGMYSSEYAGLAQKPYREILTYKVAMMLADMNDVMPINKALSDIYNRGVAIHLTNVYGTDLMMSIKGQNFVESLNLRNMGSEVFGSPVLDSVEGVIRTPGPHIYKGKFITDIAMEIQNGRIGKYSARDGMESLAAIIETDEGSHWFGEYGDGTAIYAPPYPTGMIGMDEKMGPHMAIGHDYKETPYGASVRNNAAGLIPDSAIHEDILILMRNEAKGFITVMIENENGTISKVPVMENGERVLPGTEALNKRHDYADVQKYVKERVAAINALN